MSPSIQPCLRTLWSSSSSSPGTFLWLSTVPLPPGKSLSSKWVLWPSVSLYSAPQPGEHLVCVETRLLSRHWPGSLLRVPDDGGLRWNECPSIVSSVPHTGQPAASSPSHRTPRTLTEQPPSR